MPTDKNAIATYNNNAHAWARAKRDGSAVFHTYLEKPGIYSGLADLHGKTVLCIGCGSGEEVEHLYSLGAQKVVGVDISEGLIKVAKDTYPDYEFHVMDMEVLNLDEHSFDVAFSSLTMHYIDDWKKVLQPLHKILRDNGEYIFSIGHPFWTAVEKRDDEKLRSRLFGYQRDKVTNELKIFGNYFEEKENEIMLNKVFTVKNWHRPLSSIIKDITQSDFELIDIIEPKAVRESKEVNEDFWNIHQRIPEFIIFKIKKKT